MQAVYAARYAAGRDSWSGERALRAIVPTALKEIGALAPAGRALDLGVGRGHDARVLLDLGWSVLGVDLVAVPEWNELAEAFPGRARFLEAAESDVPVAPEYDLIVDNGCLHHQPVPEQPGYLARVAGRLASGGFLLLTVFGAESPGADADAPIPPPAPPAPHECAVHTAIGTSMAHSSPDAGPDGGAGMAGADDWAGAVSEVVVTDDGRSSRFFTPAELTEFLAGAGLAARRSWTVPRAHPGARYLVVLAHREADEDQEARGAESGDRIAE
jgi:SAM-dependent methyltransferase